MVISLVAGGRSARARPSWEVARLDTTDSVTTESLRLCGEEPAIAATLRFSTADLLRCRFAISPAFETLSAIRLTLPAESPGQHRRWLDAVAGQVAGI
ncbi:hypothetical protein OG799_06620 [Micromonospora sp. NBC_00898]|uniref:hypothetical protein n=1 Tax=Micromonospora sp. NBC_00898 TaxID=2975981 RepID=UPI00386BFB2C|nr:hypothetical protein OG799_06620 [Micromonospora sp. NBC_00898]